MKTSIFTSLALASALSFSVAAEEKTLSEKAADSFDRAKETGRAIVDNAKKGAEIMVDAVTPDAEAQKIEVKLSEHKIDMPLTTTPGKKAFVVTNIGTDKHNFEIRGEGIEKKFMMRLGPKDSKTLNVDLKPGMYEVLCPEADHAGEGMKLNLMVK